MAMPAIPPPPKKMYRHTLTGQLGELITKHGKEWIKLDRPHEEILRAFNDEWVPTSNERSLTKQQVARVAFEADKALCRSLGDYETSRKQWERMRDEERIDWFDRGIPDSADKRRQKVYRALIMALTE